MADIDHFKRINDTEGHSTGDEVIRRVAEGLASEMRSGDIVCRYGGEEFCIILPAAPIEAAVAVAERLRRKVELPGFARVPVTVSFGVSSSAFGATKPTELIDQADEALYASKEAGRNRVTRWDEMDAAAG
jgi:diguanylate cyclase (GGDEF)-like protein